jgi:hypothetical protein
MRDIKEIRTEKIAVRCETVEEVQKICGLITWEKYGIEKMLDNLDTLMHGGGCYISDNGDFGWTEKQWCDANGYTIHPASEYLTPQTPAKYTAEEIVLLDMFAGRAMQGQISHSVEGWQWDEVADNAYIQADYMLTARRNFLTVKN